MILKIVLEPSDEGGFTIYVPSLPGCISEVETREEALENIREAIELYLEDEDVKIPTARQVFTTTVEVSPHAKTSHPVSS